MTEWQTALSTSVEHCPPGLQATVINNQRNVHSNNQKPSENLSDGQVINVFEISLSKQVLSWPTGKSPTSFLKTWVGNNVSPNLFLDPAIHFSECILRKPCQQE